VRSIYPVHDLHDGDARLSWIAVIDSAFDFLQL
jgi:hypothetical protein